MSVARVSSSFDGVNTSLMILTWSGWIAHLPSKPIFEAYSASLRHWSRSRNCKVTLSMQSMPAARAATIVCIFG